MSAKNPLEQTMRIALDATAAAPRDQGTAAPGAETPGAEAAEGPGAEVSEAPGAEAAAETSVPAPAPARRRAPSWARPWRRNREQRSSAFYKLLESVYDAVLITTRAGRILECNDRAAAFFRLAPDALVGIDVIALISGATEELIATINKNLECDKYTLVEARCKRADGTSFSAEIAVNAVSLDEQGELCFFVRDITVRARAQSDLEDAVERLQAHDRARMEFVSNVSHELRTPLTSMIYAVSNMLRGVVGPMPDKAVRYLERLQSDCGRLLATVNDILDLRQIENKTLVLARAVVPLGAILYDAVESMQVQAEAKGIRLSSGLPSREFFCWCDAAKIERVMLNIIGNAVKFTPAQGAIAVDLGPNPDDPKTALITVSDTGMGIPPEMLPKVARRYFRVGDQATGSGLGLAISREIVELHGGRMRFASPVPGTDRGTAVYLSLPLAPEPLVAAYTENAGTRESLRAQMGLRGYRLALARDVRELLETCFGKRPSVLILDRRAPDADIRDLILRFREDVRTKRMPVIVLGEAKLDRSEIELYRHFGVFYTELPWKDDVFAHNLALAVLGKLR